MSLEKTYNTLEGNLYKPFIFYIPDNIIPRGKEELGDIAEHIFYIDKNGKDYQVLTTESLSPLLEKATLLDGNIFLLLEQKRMLSSSEMDFLLEKYSRALNFLVLVSNWMYKNIDSIRSEISKETTVYFEVQNEAFESHMDAFIKYFSPPKIPLPKILDWSAYNENDIPPLGQLSNIAIKNSPAKKKVKKQPLITDETAQKYLLETVFGINVEYCT